MMEFQEEFLEGFEQCEKHNKELYEMMQSERKRFLSELEKQGKLYEESIKGMQRDFLQTIENTMQTHEKTWQEQIAKELEEQLAKHLPAHLEILGKELEEGFENLEKKMKIPLLELEN